MLTTLPDGLPTLPGIPMTLPNSTYRIQFRDGMTFDHARKMVPYLRQLGISHLYASPIFTATKGSTHGYDVTDTNEIDPAIGGREGFDKLSEALREADIGLLVDIVPNHMAASLENSWWRSVVEWGEESPFSQHFDIDWSRKLTLPILGKPLQDALGAGELKLTMDADAGTLTVAYYEQRLPLSPSTYAAVLSRLDLPVVAAMCTLASDADPRRETEFHQSMRDMLSGEAADINKALEQKFSDPASLQAVLDEQPWRLIYWKDAPRELSYRRFFEVTGLVGLRVEDPAVFDDAHRLTLELVRSGAVDGLRLDHIDGLADPAGYLERLRSAVGEDTYIVVEKILAEGETLPEAWPISGTTGYEFITTLPDVLVNTSGMKAITETYREIADGEPEFAEGALAVKAMLARKNFAVETNNLLKLPLSVGTINGDVPEQAALEQALVSLLVACPVYRTYGTDGALDAADGAMWRTIVETAGGSSEKPDHAALSFVDKVFQGNVPPEAKADALEFRRRFQQLTGPLTAKSIEDTMFYRYNRLIGLNEVGGEPAASEFALERFHNEMAKRMETQPAGLSATSTHDTKRGEDGRARLYALTEAPEAWLDGVERWRKINAATGASLPGGAAPEPRLEWMLYQALAGAWPADLALEAPAPADLPDRFLAYVEKALREAKQRTNWGEEDGAYEDAVKAFAANLLASDNAAFLQDFRKTLQPFVRAGLFNGLTQTLIKLAAPGIPDIYQGAEQLDLSLVDPDNRRLPDFARLGEDLAVPLQIRDESALARGLFKQRLVQKGLALRNAEPTLFAKGDYQPLAVTGERAANAIAFLRSHENKMVVAIAPRLVFGLGESEWPCGDYWRDSAIALPERAVGRVRNFIDGTVHETGQPLKLAALLATSPVALLVSE